jgi:hypothetical protein
VVLLEEETSSIHLLLLVEVAVADCPLTGLVEELIIPLPQNFEYDLNNRFVFYSSILIALYCAITIIFYRM